MKKLLALATLTSLAYCDPRIPMEMEKIYILDFFASWCSSCEKEIPIISKLNETYKKEGIELIGIDVDKNREDGEKFQKKMQRYINFSIINDTNNEIILSYKPIGMPALYVLKNNKICGKIFGATSDLETKLDVAINSCKGE